jgi:hypothetical protein
MQLIHPDILAEAKGLSIGAAGFATLVGVLLWGLGWRWHRFWIVFGITLTAGLIGLNAGQAVGGQVLAVGILLALAAGMMALEIARILAFLAGGVAAWIAVQTVLPAAREMWAVFLCGGLLGLLLYRLWTMLLTSTIGALFTVYGVVMMIEITTRADVISYAKKNAASLNLTVAILAGLGVVLQHFIANKDQKEEAAPEKTVAEEVESEEAKPNVVSVSFWKRITGKAA